MRYVNVFMLWSLAILAAARNLNAGDVSGYTLVTLPDADGLTVGRSAINDAGDVIFTKFDQVGPPSAFFDFGYVWNGNDGLRRVVVPGGPATGRLFGINESGQAVGAWRGVAGTNTSVPFLWDQSTGASSIFPGFFQAPDVVRSLALNDVGQVVGTVGVNLFDPDTFSRFGFQWESGSDPIPIPEFRQAMDVNNLGQVVGQSSGTRTALLRQPDGSFLDLGALPGDSESIAYDVNEFGVVIGASGDVEDQPTAFLWSGGTMVSLDPSGQFDSSIAYSINDLGQIVGDGVISDGRQVGWLWQEGTLWTFDDLVDSPICTPGLTCRAFDINNRGDIIGSNVVSDFVILRDAAVPEPSTLALLGLGCILMVVRDQRRRLGY